MLEEVMLVFAGVLPCKKSVKCFSLLNKIKSNKYASNSVILSLANHLTFEFPNLDLTLNSDETPKILPQKKQVNTYITCHPLQQFWCDKFIQAILSSHAIRKQNTLYIVIELNKVNLQKVIKYKNKLKQFSIDFNAQWIDNTLKQISGCQQLPRKNVHVAYLNVSGSQLRTDMYKPILNVKATILGQIYNNQKWSSYQVLKNQIPTVEELLNINSVIIPGSTNSVLSNILQIQLMSHNLFKAFALSSKLKIFGICYGHQLIAKCSKGLVVRKQRTDKIQTYELEKQKIEKLKSQFSFLSSFPIQEKPLQLLEHHQDYVQTVPQDFHLLAKSQTSKVQILLHKSGRILSFQSHPEYYYQFTQGYMQRLTRYHSYNKLPEYQVRNGEQNKLNDHHKSANKMRHVISQFLNWNCA